MIVRQGLSEFHAIEIGIEISTTIISTFHYKLSHQIIPILHFVAQAFIDLDISLRLHTEVRRNRIVDVVFATDDLKI